MRRFYNYLPRQIRIEDYQAAGYVPDAPRYDVPIGGADGTFLGGLVAYRFRLAGHALTPYGVYYLQTQVGTDPVQAGEFQNVPSARDEIVFDYSTELAAPHTFRVWVYDDRRMRAEDLLFAAESASDSLGWSVRQEAIFEKISSILDFEAEVAELSIANLVDLVDVDRTTPTGLLMLSYYLGQLLDGTKPLVFQRWLVANLVALYKIKGTTHSWKKRQQLTLGTHVPHVELWKTTVYEKCDYSMERDAAHPFKSARFAFPGPCASGCETGAEIPELPRSAVADVLDVIEDVRPVHVIMRVPCRNFDFEDEFPAFEESLAPIEGVITFSETFPLFDDTLDIIRSCVSLAQTGCLSCCETDCTACEAFSCVTDACQIGCTASCTGAGEAGCTFGCEAACMAGVQPGGGGGGGGLCDLFVEAPGGGCGGTNPTGGLVCQTPIQVPDPPPPPGCDTLCEPSPTAFLTCCQASNQQGTRPGKLYMVTYQRNAETGTTQRVTGLVELSKALKEAQDAGVPILTGEDLTEAIDDVLEDRVTGGGVGEGGVPQGLVTSGTGNPCNSCGAAVTGTISTGAQAYPSQQGP